MCRAWQVGTLLATLSGELLTHTTEQEVSVEPCEGDLSLCGPAVPWGLHGYSLGLQPEKLWAALLPGGGTETFRLLDMPSGHCPWLPTTCGDTRQGLEGWLPAWRSSPAGLAAVEVSGGHWEGTKCSAPFSLVGLSCLFLEYFTG